MYVVSNLVLQEDLCIWVGRVNGLHRGASPCGGSATLFKLFYVLCYSNLYTHYFQVRPPLLHAYNEPKFGYPPFLLLHKINLWQVIVILEIYYESNLEQVSH